MRITRLYIAEKLSCGDKTQLDKNTSNHLVRVLRTRKNSPLILFNGDGFDYLAVTLDENTKKTTVLIESRTRIDNESNLSITLIQGLSRQHRMETSVQKSVELGVNKIIPVLCQRSNLRLNPEKTSKKLSHWRNVAISASEQSGRCIVPEITDICTLENIAQHFSDQENKITLQPDAEKSLNEITPKDDSVVIFIGPEGGLNTGELTALKQLGFDTIRFGPRILRTETAGPAVISAMQALWGDF